MFGLAAAVHGSIPGGYIYRSWVLINRYEQAEIVLQDLHTLRLFPECTLACSKFMHWLQQKEIANLLEKDCLYCMQHETKNIMHSSKTYSSKIWLQRTRSVSKNIQKRASWLKIIIVGNALCSCLSQCSIYTVKLYSKITSNISTLW
jgi:hypothetical protein